MNVRKITHQKVMGILKRDFFKKHGFGPISKAMFQKIVLEKDEPFKKLKRGEEIFLTTGAKIIASDNKYYICGYAWDNRDILHYFK